MTLLSIKVIWALDRDLVRSTSPDSTLSWSATGVAGSFPPFRRSTRPSTWVMCPTASADAQAGSIKPQANIRMTLARIVRGLISPPLT